MGVPKAKQSLFSSTLFMMKVDDSTVFLKNYEVNMVALNEVFKTGKIPFQKSFELKKVKVGKTPALEIINDLSDNPGLANLPKVAEALFGEGGKMRATVVPADDKTIVIGYVSPKGMKEVLATYRKKTWLSEDEDVAKTAALLPNGAQWAAFFNPRGIMDTINQLQPNQLPGFPQTAPVGAALRFSASGVEARVVIPSAVLEGAGDLAQNVFKILRQQ